MDDPNTSVDWSQFVAPMHQCHQSCFVLWRTLADEANQSLDDSDRQDDNARQCADVGTAVILGGVQAVPALVSGEPPENARLRARKEYGNRAIESPPRRQAFV